MKFFFFLFLFQARQFGQRCSRASCSEDSIKVLDTWTEGQVGNIYNALCGSLSSHKVRGLTLVYLCRTSTKRREIGKVGVDQITPA